MNASYFAIIPDRSIEMIFDSKDKWAAYLKALNVNSENLYDVLVVYTAFKDDYKSLPWYEQIKM